MGVDAQNSLSPRKGAAARNPGGRQPASRLSPLLTPLPGQAKAGFTWAGISHPRASVGQPAALDEKSGVVTDTQSYGRGVSRRLRGGQAPTEPPPCWGGSLSAVMSLALLVIR